MITGEKTIAVRISIFAKSLDMMTDIQGKIQRDFVSVVKHYEDENTDEIKVHLAPDFRCGYCNQLFHDCQCGKPKPRPAV